MAYRRTLLQELKTLLHVESILAFSSLVILIINGCLRQQPDPQRSVSFPYPYRETLHYKV